MLRINKNTVIENFIDEDYITKYLKSLTVNETIPPVRNFNIIGIRNNDSSKKYNITFTDVAYTRIENGITIKDYCYEGLIKKILNISKEYGEILKID